MCKQEMQLAPPDGPDPVFICTITGVSVPLEDLLVHPRFPFIRLCTRLRSWACGSGRKSAPAIPDNRTHLSFLPLWGIKVLFKQQDELQSRLLTVVQPITVFQVCVSGSPLSERSAPWPPAGRPSAGRPGSRRASLKAGRTWQGREGAAAGALS